MDKEVLKRIGEADWEGIIPKLTYYALLKIKRLSWKYERLPKGLTPEDVVLETIADVLDSKRNWNPSKDPDLYTFFKSVVDSKVSHLYKLREYEATKPFPKTEDGQIVEELLEKADPISDHAIYSTAPSPNPEEALLEKEKKKADEATVNLFFETVKEDKELEELTVLIMEGCTKPAEIAEQMKIDVKEVYNLQKRFRRKCKEFRKDNI